MSVSLHAHLYKNIFSLTRLSKRNFRENNKSGPYLPLSNTSYFLWATYSQAFIWKRDQSWPFHIAKSSNSNSVSYLRLHAIIQIRMSPKAFTKNHQEKPSVSQFVFFRFILLQLFRDKTWLSPVGLGLMCVMIITIQTDFYSATRRFP